MNAQKQKNKYSFVLTIVLLFLCLNVIRSIRHKQKSMDRLSNAKEELSSIEAKNSELRQELEYVKTESYIEKVAVEDLNMAKPNQTIIIVEDTPNFATQEKKKEIDNQAEPTRTNRELWLEAFNL